MNVTKPWYLSRTIWASLVAVGSATAGLFGFPIEAFETAALTDSLLEAVAAISGIVAVLGRVAATTRIG